MKEAYPNKISVYVVCALPPVDNCQRYAIPAEAKLEAVDRKQRARGEHWTKEKHTQTFYEGDGLTKKGRTGERAEGRQSGRTRRRNGR